MPKNPEQQPTPPQPQPQPQPPQPIIPPPESLPPFRKRDGDFLPEHVEPDKPWDR